MTTDSQTGALPAAGESLGEKLRAAGAESGQSRRGARAFISYSRKDTPFVRSLATGLAERGIDVWVDWEGILPTADWMNEIRSAIESVDAFIVVLSAHSLASGVCGEELHHALAHNKRLVPVVCQDVDPAAAPREVARINWIFMRPGDDFTAGADKVAAALNTDLESVHTHTRLLQEAIEWDASGRDGSLLLRGSSLHAAEAWLAASTGKEPHPTALQVQYILAGRKAAVRRHRVLGGLMAAALIMTIALAVWALVERNTALFQRTLATARQLAAESTTQLSTDPEVSLILARDAVSTHDTPQTGDALRQALFRSQVRAGMYGQHGEVRTVQFSRDGRFVVTADKEDQSARVWDARTGSLRAVLREPGACHAAGCYVTGAAFSPDGRLVAVSGSGPVRLWDWRAHRLRQSLTSSAAQYSVAFSPHGDSIVGGGVDGSTTIWDVAHNTVMARLGDHSDSVYSALFSPNGKYVASGGLDKTVVVWTWPGRVRVAVLHCSDQIHMIRFSPDSASIATATVDGTVKLWDWKHERGERTLTTSAPADGASFSPDGRYIATAGGDDVTRVWDRGTGKLLDTLAGDTDRMEDAEFSPDGRLLATSSVDGSARIWEWGADRSRQDYWAPNTYVSLATISADGSTVLGAMGDGTARIWQRATGKQIARLPAGSKALEDASFSPNGQLVVTAGDDGRVRIWSRRTGRFVATYRGDGKKVYTAAFGPDSRYVVFGGAGQVAHVWNWRANQVWTLRAGQDVYAAAFTADGKDVLLGTDVAFVVSGAAATGRNHPLQLWDWRAQRTLIPAADGDNRLFGHTDRVDAVSFSRDGRYAVSAGADNTARIWDMHTRKEAGVLKGNRAPVTGAVFGADDDIVITAGQDRTLRIWDWRTATQLATYADTNDILSGLGISADGRWLTVPGYTSGEAHLYRCDICESVPQLVQLARSRITRELTPQEQAQLLSQ